ncbi:MAG: DUF4302 domain-containing protein [Marinifilaceae bacterium]
MNKLLYTGLLLFVVLFSACSDDEFENVFDKSPEERVALTNQSFKDILVGSEHGWLGYYGSVENVGGWAVAMRFTDDNWVKIKSDSIGIIPLSGFTSELTYNVNTTQTTKLVFESSCIFNIWHGLKVNKPASNGGTVTVPLGGGEFQFVIKSATTDRVVLESLTDKEEPKSTLILKKAAAEDWIFEKEKLEEMKNMIKDGFTSKDFFRNVKVEGVDYFGQFRVDEEFRIATFDHLDGTEIKSSKHRIAITSQGFVLLDSLKINDQLKIASFVYNKEADVFESNDGGVKTSIQYSNVPGIIYFPFVDEWGFKDGKKVDCTMDYSVMNGFKGVVSQEFYDLCSKVRIADGLKNIDFYMNNEKNPSGCSTTISLKYWKKVNPPYGYSNIIVDIPVEVVREKNTRVIFKLKDDYRKAFRKEIEHIDLISPESAEELITLLTDKEGFYLLPDVYYSKYNNQPYQVVVLISVAKPEYRFVTEYLEFTKAED